AVAREHRPDQRADEPRTDDDEEQRQRDVAEDEVDLRILEVGDREDQDDDDTDAGDDLPAARPEPIGRPAARPTPTSAHGCLLARRATERSRCWCGPERTDGGR